MCDTCRELIEELESLVGSTSMPPTARSKLAGYLAGIREREGIVSGDAGSLERKRLKTACERGVLVAANPRKNNDEVKAEIKKMFKEAMG